MDFQNLSSLHLDVLKEIGNIGSGNAATALSTMLNRKIDMDVPNISVLPFPQVIEILGGAERLVAGSYLQVEGNAPMSILFVVPRDSISLFLEILLGKSDPRDTVLDDLSASVIKEVTNILAGSYLTALSTLTNMVFTQSVPLLAYDMVGAILGDVLQLYGEVSDYALIIETVFLETDRQVQGHLFLLPEPGSLETIFQSLGVVI